MVKLRNSEVQKLRNLLLLFLLFFMTTTVYCQTVESLEKKIQSIQKDIKLAEKLLKETSKDKETSINQVSLLQTQIRQRESLIKTYQNQVNAINKDIQDNKNQITLLEKNLELLRKEYSNLLVISYRNKGKANNLLFIFSSEDFNQAMRRMRYIQELNDLVKNKIEEIDSAQIKIQLQLEKNEKNKKDKEKILAKQIENIIAEEIKKAKEREEAAKKNNTKSVDYNLSNNFAQNKGKLPYPVEQGIITGKYGLTQHPTQKKVTVNNNGIDISTTKGSKARCVFDGEVCGVMNQGGNSVILVRHGLYFTLYSNLEKVYVKMKDKVVTGQEIGKIHTNASDGKTILHFEIWQENRTTVNPTLWIKK